VKSVLVVGNKGSFCDESIEYLSDVFDVLSFSASEVPSEWGDRVSPLGKKFHNFVDSHNHLEALVFLGGEVRNTEIMMLENYQKPLLLAKFAFERRIQFIYLSSLAVYDGINRSNPLKISRDSEENTSSLYGQSKLKLDKEIASLRCQGLNCFTLRPASIVGSQRMNSSVEKVAKLALRFGVVRYFGFDGVISYTTRGDLTKVIIGCLQGEFRSGVLLVANNYCISDVIWSLKDKPNWFIPLDGLLTCFGWALTPLGITAFSNVTNKLTYVADHRASLQESEPEVLKSILENVQISLSESK
jgi:nucleoside-diphosphate-sugar epimerase